MLFRTNCDFTAGSTKTDSGYIRSSIHECFRRKLLKLREETGFERVGQYYIVGDIPSDKTYTAAFLHGSANALYDEKPDEFI